LSAPLGEGQVVGTINVQLGEELVASRNLVTLAAVEEAGFFGSTWDSLQLWMNGLFEDEEDASSGAVAEAEEANGE
jgi:D-alanyl-D-alanine carboxypeptidase (penicillin-binding protein 5/6)